MSFTKISFMLCFAVLSGCASKISPPPYAFPENEVLKIYSEEQIDNVDHISLGIIRATECSPTWYRFSTSDDALSRLLIEAKKQGATGVKNVTCWDSGVGPRFWCNNSATCEGEAVVVK